MYRILKSTFWNVFGTDSWYEFIQNKTNQKYNNCGF